MSAVGALSARPVLTGQRLQVGRQTRGARAARAAMSPTRAEGYKPGIHQPEGDADALNKWSRKITQPKSQGASQVRNSNECSSAHGLYTDLLGVAASMPPSHPTRK